MYTLCDCSHHSCDYFAEESKPVCIVHVSATRRYFSMDNKLQLLLTLSVLAAVMQQNSAFHHATTAYMCRRKDIISKLQ